MDNYQEWTSCQWSGHRFEDGHCVDCGEHDASSDIEQSHERTNKFTN